MKKLFCLIIIALCLSCDDGDMTFKTFDFDENAAPQQCGESNLLFKINDTEVLLLNIDASNFRNAANGDGEIITISGTNTLVYRNYNGTVSSAILCADIPPANPVVTEEWLAEAGGQIRIITTASTNDDGVLIGYNHQITLLRIKFTKGDEEIIINDNLFGTYTTPLDYTFNFLDADNTAEIEKCEENNLLYKTTASESLVLNLDMETAFDTITGNETINLEGNATNALYFNVYSGNVSSASICNIITPVTPIVETRWNATTGNLLITTTAVDSTYRHQIYLSNVKFVRADNTGETFTVGAPLNGQANNYLIGTYITPQ